MQDNNVKLTDVCSKCGDKYEDILGIGCCGKCFDKIKNDNNGK